MKKLFLLLVIGFVIYGAKEKGPEIYKKLTFEPPKQGMGIIIDSEKEIRIQNLISSNRSFSDLSDPGTVTIVFVNSNACSHCQGLRNKIDQLKSFRSDVVVHTVKHLFVPPKFRDNTEKQKFDQKSNGLNSQLDIAGPGHIEIYNPDQQLMARDEPKTRDGKIYLDRWLEYERNK